MSIHTALESSQQHNNEAFFHFFASIQDRLRPCKALGAALTGCRPQLLESTVLYSQKARPCSRALPGQPSFLLVLPRNDMFRLPWLPLTLLHKAALPKGVSTSSFSPRFALPGQPGTHRLGGGTDPVYRQVPHFPVTLLLLSIFCQ